MSALDAADLVDGLYRRAILSPGEIDDAALAEWMEEALEAVGHDRVQGRALRAAVRVARKLSTYYSVPRATLPDWRNGVDEVLGARGWEPQLDLVRHEFAAAPGPDLFEAVKERHRAVHFTEWMEGIAFETWKASRNR
ncbi:MAG: hypothetical protein HZA58_10775 [Acidimicrobiia bacterium]|nr:hypothetical protein [Acidimicrobiia bacterium]